MLWVRKRNQVNWAVAEYIFLIKLLSDCLNQRIQIKNRHRSLWKEIPTTPIFLREKLIKRANQRNFSIRLDQKGDWHWIYLALHTYWGGFYYSSVLAEVSNEFSKGFVDFWDDYLEFMLKRRGKDIVNLQYYFFCDFNFPPYKILYRLNLLHI